MRGRLAWGWGPTHLKMSAHELYLIRHGIAEERGDKWPDDTKRPLTEEGISRLRRSARGLDRLESPDRIQEGRRLQDRRRRAAAECARRPALVPDAEDSPAARLVSNLTASSSHAV